MTRQPELLVLVCNADPEHCRWRPPNDLPMSLVEAHFDLEERHDPNDIRLDMVAWCHHCNGEMKLFRSVELGQGAQRHHYQCPACRRTRSCVQVPPAEEDPVG